jgi:hypothetical protein
LGIALNRFALYTRAANEKQTDLGLLILRGAGLLLALTFGVQKIGWYWSALHAGKSFSSMGLAPLIAKMGFPIPVALAIWITFNESIGADRTRGVPLNSYFFLLTC